MSQFIVQVQFFYERFHRDADFHPLPTLIQRGWTEEYAQAFANYDGHYVPGRVTCRQKASWEVIYEGGCGIGGISGALRRLSRFPAVGEFVVLNNQPGASTIVDILP